MFRRTRIRRRQLLFSIKGFRQPNQIGWLWSLEVPALKLSQYLSEKHHFYGRRGKRDIILSKIAKVKGSFPQLSRFWSLSLIFFWDENSHFWLTWNKFIFIWMYDMSSPQKLMNREIRDKQKSGGIQNSSRKTAFIGEVSFWPYFHKSRRKKLS